MPPVSRVTLKDVAARAGVSYQTVSKVINGQGTVGRETEELIWQVVADLGYRTNVTARSLRKQSTGLIGYTWTPMPPDRVNPILDRFLTGTTQAAEAVGYHLMLFPSPASDEHVSVYRQLIHSGRVDGFIVASTNYDDPRIKLLMELDFPFVAFGRANPDWDFCYVDVNGRAGVRAATEHLLAQGHRADCRDRLARRLARGHVPLCRLSRRHDCRGDRAPPSLARPHRKQLPRQLRHYTGPAGAAPRRTAHRRRGARR